jgi:hypothetical protein
LRSRTSDGLVAVDSDEREKFHELPPHFINIS